MARLLGPDMGSRYCYTSTGAPAAGATATVYANSAGTVLADIATYDGTQTPGGTIANSQVSVDTDGLLPLFWLPDGVDRVWVSVNGGTVTPVDADYNARIDAVAAIGVFNVRAYGAVGDGVTDDTTAILAATTAAHTAQLGVVYFPAGKYKLTSSSWSVITRRVSIVGDGPQTTQIWPTGLAAGTYALTLGWENTEVGQKSEPYDAIRGVSFIGPTGAGQANCLRLGGSPSTTFYANSLTIRDVGFYGFDTQVDLANNVYLVGFDRVSFNAPHTYGVKMGQVTNAGENIAFRSCLFANGTSATMVFLDQTSSSFFFAECSFDYSHRALHQRAGMVFMSQCHFETDTAHGGPGDAFLLVDRNGLVDRPVLSLTDCDFFALWDDYDTCVRLLGDNGDQALRIVNPSVKTTATQCPYFVRDDGPVASDIRISGAWYSSGSFTPPKLRNQAGVEWPITAGQVHTHDGPGAEGAWTDFSAALALQSQTSTDPTKGNSTYTARYRRTGKTVDFTFQITIGSTFTPGAGLYRIPLPVAALSALGVGSAYVLDGGTPQTGILRVYATQYLEIHLDNLTAALGAAGPGTAWATGDVIGGTVTYETA